MSATSVPARRRPAANLPDLAGGECWPAARRAGGDALRHERNDRDPAALRIIESSSRGLTTAPRLWYR